MRGRRSRDVSPSMKIHSQVTRTQFDAIEEMDQGAGSRKTRGRGVGWEA